MAKNVKDHANSTNIGFMLSFIFLFLFIIFILVASPPEGIIQTSFLYFIIAIPLLLFLKKKTTPNEAGLKKYIFRLRIANVIALIPVLIATLLFLSLFLTPNNPMAFWIFLILFFTASPFFLLLAVIAIINLKTLYTYKAKYKRKISKKANSAIIIYSIITLLYGGLLPFSVAMGELDAFQGKRDNEYYRNHPISKEDAIKLINNCETFAIKYYKQGKGSTVGFWGANNKHTDGKYYPELHKVALAASEHCGERIGTSGNDYYPDDKPVYITFDKAKELINKCNITALRTYPTPEGITKPETGDPTGIILYNEKDPLVIYVESKELKNKMLRVFRDTMNKCKDLSENP